MYAVDQSLFPFLLSFVPYFVLSRGHGHCLLFLLS